MCSNVFKSLVNKSKYVILCKVKLLNLKCNYSDAIRLKPGLVCFNCESFLGPNKRCDSTNLTFLTRRNEIRCVCRCAGDLKTSVLEILDGSCETPDNLKTCGEAMCTQTRPTPNLTRPSYQEVSTAATPCLAIPNGAR